MARLQTEEGIVVDTTKATEQWEEATFWDGRNHISKATSSQWDHETMYRSSKGRYYLVHSSQWQGSQDYAEFVNNHEAATWLLANDKDLPADLAPIAEEVSE